jgi:TP901 family phage tail tape measure protein
MSKFVLTAQLQLQAPSNTRQVVQQIQRQLQGGVNLNVQLKNAPAAQRQLTQINKQVSNLNSQGKNLSKNFGISIRRFASFTIASRAVSLFTNKLASAVDEAIKFEREVVKIAQVTGKSVQELNGLTKTITNLSSNLGVASQELVSTTRILAQAGIKANDLEVALSALAKTTLAPTFEDINKTAEGAVAILAQFKQGVGALEGQLGSINKVAGQFAVESGDLISAVRRFGGVFKSAGGELDELLGLFTSVRATTRESAESIATGLRTIFTRIQRPKTIEFLKQFGVQLTDLEGKFVGPFEAVRQLSQAFAGLEEGDITFVRVAEELGGFRQIGKVIPLIQQFTVAEKARQAALEGRGSLDSDAVKAQQALAVQISKVREEFFALIRGISETGTFQILVKSTLALTSQLIKLADAFKPLLPLLTAFAGIKIASSIGNIARGVGAGFLGRNQGGPIGFASGGVVPGQGNRDTVPAMLTPGEFVIRKSSVGKIGAGTLQAMNSNKFAKGGNVADISDKFGYNFIDDTSSIKGSFSDTKIPVSMLDSLAQSELSSSIGGNVNRFVRKGSGLSAVEAKAVENFINGSGPVTSGQKSSLVAAGLAPSQKAAASLNRSQVKRQLIKQKRLISGFEEGSTLTASGGSAAGLLPSASTIFDKHIDQQLPKLFTKAVSKFNPPLGSGQDIPLNKLISESAINSIRGQFFEVFVRRATNQEIKETKKDPLFDFKTGDPAGFNALFGSSIFPSEFKINNSRENIASAYGKAIKEGLSVKKLASGGGISGSDTVPAMLTPGEFVINKKAAQSIGADNLNRMNKQGVVGFAAGGPVTPNRHLYGNGPLDGELIIPGNRSVSKSEGPGPGEGAKVLIQFVEEMDNATGTLIDLQGEMENFKKLIINVLKGIVDANRGMTVGKQSTGFTQVSDTAVSSPVRFKKGPAGLLSAPAGKKKDPKAKETPKKQEDAAKKTLGDVGALGVKLLGINAALTPFITSGEEAAKNTFNFANALQTGVTRFVAFNAAIEKSKEFFEKNVQKNEKGNLEFIRGGTSDKFAQKIRVGGKRLARSGRAASGRGSLLGKASGKIQQRIGTGFGKLAGGLTKFGPKFLKFLPGIGQAINYITSISSALAAGFAAQEKYNLAIKQGNVQKAQEFAVLKELTGVEQAILSVAGTGGTLADIFTGLRGTTTEYLMASAKAAAIASKADKEKAENARLASDAFKEVAAGTMSLTQALSGAGGGGFRSALEVRNAERDEIRAREGTRSTGSFSSARDVGSLVSFGLMESANTKNINITAKNEEQQQASQEKLAKSFEEIFPKVNELGREFARGGGTLAEFEAKLIKMGIPLNEVKGASERVARAFQNNVEGLKRSREAFQALNFGLTPLLKTTEGLNTGLNTLTDISNGTYNALNNAKSVLESAATGATVDDKAFNDALSTVEKDLKAFGGGEQLSKIRKTITALREASEGAGPALEEFRSKLITGEIDDANPKELISGLTDTLTENMGPESKKIIQEALGDIKLDKDTVEKIISDGNLDELFKIIEEKGGEVFKELGPLIDNIVNAQSSLLDLTKKRIVAEQQLVAAQLSSANAQREAAKLIAEFSGKQLSGGDQANLAAGRLRATGINAQDAGSLSNTLAFNSLAQQNNVASLSATGGAALGGQDRAAVEANQQKLNSQNAEILTYARERVKIYQQEIAAAKQRLKLEQDAAQALLAGDVAKFAENINASIAASAFRSGDTASLQALGGEAVAAGFGSLTDEEKRAAKPQLEALGLSSGLADSAAGTSSEIQALQAEAIEYAQIIAQSGDAGVRLAEASLTAAENLETLGKQALETAQNKAAEQQAEFNAKKKETEAAAAKVEADRKAREEAEKAAKAAEEKRLGDAAQAEADAALADPNRFRQESDSALGIYFGRQQPGEQIGQSVGGSMFNGNNQFEQTRNLSVRRAKGGTIYASRGMFVPKGTDTVPAMLTPGEFVVNRSAVQRGNNLQILRSMNGGDTTPNGAPAAMSKGGSVGYYNQGGEVTAGMGDFINGMSQAISQLGGAFGTFSQSVQQLANMKLSVNLSPTRVDVNVIGPMLSELTDATKEVVLNAVVSEIQLNQLGQLERTV